MKKTANYNLNLPESADYYSVEDTNDNMRIIDETLKECAGEIDGFVEGLQNVSEDVTEQEQELSNVKTTLESVQTTMSGMQTTMSNVQSTMTGIQSNMAGMQTAISSTQSTLTNVQTTLASVQEELANTQKIEGANIFLDHALLSNDDSRVSISGYIRGDEAHLNVSGWIGANTIKNNLRMRKLFDGNAEYAKIFQQFDVDVSVPYNATTGGYRPATISIIVGKGAIGEYVFTKKGTTETVKSYNMNDYINNSAYEWSDMISHDGIEVWCQNMPDVTMATYPLCINASASLIFDGE